MQRRRFARVRGSNLDRQPTPEAVATDNRPVNPCLIKRGDYRRGAIAKAEIGRCRLARAMSRKVGRQHAVMRLQVLKLRRHVRSVAESPAVEEHDRGCAGASLLVGQPDPRALRQSIPLSEAAPGFKP